MVYTGLGYVASPPAEPPVVGLIPTLIGTPYLDPPDPTAIRWEGAVRFQPEQSCNIMAVVDPCNVTTMNLPANPAIVEAAPFLVIAGDRCSTFGWSSHDYRGRATRALLAAESKAISTEFWKGTRAQASSWPNRYLASANADALTNGPTTPANALGILEQYLGDCSNGQRGMIHCTRQLAAMWSELGNTYRQTDGRLLTYNGTYISPDAGNDGSGPHGQPRIDGSQWAYATLVPTVRRGPIDIYPDTFEEAIVMGTNDLVFRAERPAVVAMPLCCHGAVEVNVPLPLIGGAS